MRVRFTRVSMLTQRVSSRDIGIEKLSDLERYKGGEAVQKCFPYLSDDDREFIRSGITPEEWEENLPPEDEESEDIAPCEVDEEEPF